MPRPAGVPGPAQAVGDEHANAVQRQRLEGQHAGVGLGEQQLHGPQRRLRRSLGDAHEYARAAVGGPAGEVVQPLDRLLVEEMGVVDGDQHPPVGGQTPDQLVHGLELLRRPSAARCRCRSARPMAVEQLLDERREGPLAALRRPGAQHRPATVTGAPGGRADRRGLAEPDATLDDERARRAVPVVGEQRIDRRQQPLALEKTGAGLPLAAQAGAGAEVTRTTIEGREQCASSRACPSALPGSAPYPTLRPRSQQY
jgi:hypothetical protein